MTAAVSGYVTLWPARTPYHQSDLHFVSDRGTRRDGTLTVHWSLVFGVVVFFTRGALLCFTRLPNSGLISFSHQKSFLDVRASLHTSKCRTRGSQVKPPAHDVHNYKRSQQTGHAATHRWDCGAKLWSTAHRKTHFHLSGLLITSCFILFVLLSRAHTAAGQQNQWLQAQTNVLEYAWVGAQVVKGDNCKEMIAL